MRCDYTVTYRDFVESVKAYRRVSRQALIGYILYVWVTPLVGMTLGVYFLVEFFKGGATDYGTTGLAGVLLLAIGFGFPARYRVGIRRAYQQRDELLKGGTMYTEFGPETVRFVVPAGAEISYPWESFTHYFENEDVFVLFVKAAAFHTVPKRAMDESGWAELRTIVDGHPGVRRC